MLLMVISAPVPLLLSCLAFSKLETVENPRAQIIIQNYDRSLQYLLDCWLNGLEIQWLLSTLIQLQPWQFLKEISLRIFI